MFVIDEKKFKENKWTRSQYLRQIAEAMGKDMTMPIWLHDHNLHMWTVIDPENKPKDLIEMMKYFNVSVTKDERRGVFVSGGAFNPVQFDSSSWEIGAIIACINEAKL